MNPFTRTTCACAECVACCRHQPGALAPGDFERIADFLKLPRERAPEYFWASPGALVMDPCSGQVRRITTITPRFEQGACVFLNKDERCTIHAVAPFGCAYFDTHMSTAEGQYRAGWYLGRIDGDSDYRRLRGTLPLATHYAPRGFAWK